MRKQLFSNALTRVLLMFLIAAIGIAGVATFLLSPAHPIAGAAVGAVALLAFHTGFPVYIGDPRFKGVGVGGWRGLFASDLGASTAETLTALSGDIKTVYGNQLVQVLPDAAMLQKKFPLADSADYPLVGDYFSALIGLQFPWGFSFLGQGYEGTSTNTTLGDSLAGQTQPAKIYPCTTVLTDNLAYQILDRANTSGSKQAVLSALAYTGKQMAINMRNVLELQILHGRDGIGIISATGVTGAGPYVLHLDPASTSAGILSILLGARLQLMQTNNTTARSTNTSAIYGTVTAIGISDTDPTITVTQTGAAGFNNGVATDIVYIAGTRGIAVTAGDTNVPHYEQIGLGTQLSATTGSVFSIDKSAYIGWVANQMTAIGAFSPSILMSAAQKSMSRGGELGDYLAILSPAQWSVLNSALATNEMYNQQAPSFSMQKKTGTDEIVIKHGGITIECMSHPFQKDGQFYFVPVSELKRIGSVDLTFAIPGQPESQEYYYPLPGNALMQRQCRADWQMVLLKPPAGTVGTGITYS